MRLSEGRCLFVAYLWGKPQPVTKVSTKQAYSFTRHPGSLVGIIDYQWGPVLKDPTGHAVIGRYANLIFFHAGCDERPQLVELLIVQEYRTPFGIHDLDLAAQMVRNLKLPFAVVGNRADHGIGALREYCAGEEIPILMEIPDDLRIARTCSRGELIVDTLPEYAVRFSELFAQVEDRVTG